MEVQGLGAAAGEYGQRQSEEGSQAGSGGAGTEGAAVEQHRGRIATEGARRARRSARQCYRRRAASSTGPVSLTWDRIVSPQMSFPGPFT